MREIKFSNPPSCISHDLVDCFSLTFSFDIESTTSSKKTLNLHNKTIVRFQEAGTSFLIRFSQELQIFLLFQLV